MSEDRDSQIIEISLLKWISILTNQKISSFEQLSQGQLYFDFLSKVPYFKLVRPLKNISFEKEDSISLANRVSNTKIIGQSMIRYYQTNLMKDVSLMKINYVQLCMGSSSQSIKLFSLLIGIFAHDDQNQTFKHMSESIQKLQCDDQYIVRALLQNTKNIGDSISMKRQDSPIQKRMLSKLQIYQQKIQSLELEIYSLRLELQEQKSAKQFAQSQIKELKSEKSKLIQKSQVLQVLNSRLQSQNSSFILENQNLAKKVQSQKRYYQQLIYINNQRTSSWQKQIELVDSMKSKIDQLKQVNNQLKQQLTDKIQFFDGQQTKFRLMKQNYSQLQQSYKKLQQKLNGVELEYQEQIYEKGGVFGGCSGSNNERMFSPGYRIGNNSQLSSIKCRMRDRLQSALKGQLSGYQMVNSHLAKKQKKNTNSQNKNSNPYSNHGNLFSSNCYADNANNFIINQINNPNIRDIQNISEFQGNQNSHQEYKLDESIIIEDEQQTLKAIHNINCNVQQVTSLKRNEVPKDRMSTTQIVKVLQKCQKRKEQEHSVLILIVEELYENNRKLQGQLRRYQQIKQSKEKRLQIFKKKLSKMRQIQPLQQVNSEFQIMKQNITPNKINHFPMTLLRNKNQQINQYNNQKTDSQNKYPYYQMTLN